MIQQRTRVGMVMLALGVGLCVMILGIRLAAADDCSDFDVEAVIDDADDEDVEDVAKAELAKVPHACLVPALARAMDGYHPWRTIVSTNALGLQDLRLLEAMLDILVHYPPDAGFDALTEGLVRQGRGSEKALARLGALAISTRVRDQGTPRETAITVLGQLGADAGSQLDKLLSMAARDPDDGIRDVARDAAMAIVVAAAARGDVVQVVPRKQKKAKKAVKVVANEESGS